MRLQVKRNSRVDTPESQHTRHVLRDKGVRALSFDETKEGELIGLVDDHRVTLFRHNGYQGTAVSVQVPKFDGVMNPEGKSVDAHAAMYTNVDFVVRAYVTDSDVLGLSPGRGSKVQRLLDWYEERQGVIKSPKYNHSSMEISAVEHALSDLQGLEWVMGRTRVGSDEQALERGVYRIFDRELIDVVTDRFKLYRAATVTQRSQLQ